jgi:predicted transposase YdaD
VLADRVRYFKEDEKGVTVMCKAMEDMRNEERNEERIEIAERLLALKKLSYEEISEASRLSVEKIKELDSKESA